MATREPVEIRETLDERRVIKAVLSHREIIQKARVQFEAYDDTRWEKTAFYPSGGFVVTEWERRRYAQKSNSERQVFAKEQRMANTYASFGFQIEHLYEPRGPKRVDAIVVRHVSPRVKVNGLLADFKSLNSSNNVKREAYDAVSKGAKLVLFEFKNKDKTKIRNELRKLTNKNIRGYYYFTGEKEYHSF